VGTNPYRIFQSSLFVQADRYIRAWISKKKLLACASIVIQAAKTVPQFNWR